MPKPQTPEQRLEAAMAECKDLIRQCHEAAQQLADASKAARAQVDDYLHDGVQDALNQYTGMLQEQIDKSLRILASTADIALAKLRGQLQAVADTHSLLYITLAHGLSLALDPPNSTMQERRQAIIDAGNVMVRVYQQAGLKTADESLPADLIERVKALSDPAPSTMARIVDFLEENHRKVK